MEYTDHAGKVYVILKRYHYRWRRGNWYNLTIGCAVPILRWWDNNEYRSVYNYWQAQDRLPGLEILSLDQYMRRIQIVSMQSTHYLSTGHVCYFTFHEDHPLHKSHIQRLVFDKIETVTNFEMLKCVEKWIRKSQSKYKVYIGMGPNTNIHMLLYIHTHDECVYSSNHTCTYRRHVNEHLCLSSQDCNTGQLDSCA